MASASVAESIEERLERGEVVFYPQTPFILPAGEDYAFLLDHQMVKDLRSEHETGNIDGVFDGALDDFMEAFLRWQRSESLTVE